MIARGDKGEEERMNRKGGRKNKGSEAKMTFYPANRKWTF